MEKVAIDLCDTSPNKTNLKLAQIMRFQDIQGSLNDLFSPISTNENKYESLKYIQSGILAGLLFNKYEKANETDKSTILSKIGNILNGKEPIQSIIDSEHLSLDDSQQYFDSIQECIKNINSIEHNNEER